MVQTQTILTKENLDGASLVVKTEGGLQGDATPEVPKVQANIIFSDREAYAQGDQIETLLFREVLNGNVQMICTGVKINGKWYGDAPDNEEFTNVFTGETYNKQPTKGIVRVVETYNGVELHLINAGDQHDFRNSLKNVSWNGQVFDTTLSVNTLAGGEALINDKDTTTYGFKSTNTVMAFANEFTISFDTDDGHYSATLPMVKDNGSLRTYEASSEQSIYDVLHFTPKEQ